MKYFKLKENDLIIYNLEKIMTKSESEKYKGGLFSHLGTFKDCLCKSLDDLRKEIYKQEFEYDIDEEDENAGINAKKLVEEIISRAGIEEYELVYPNIPCIVVKIEELSDQFECDANRTPLLYLKSMTQLENINLNGLYEIYSIKKNGSFKLESKFSTYRIFSDDDE